MKKLDYRQINRLAFPAIVAGISEPMMALADTAIIGHLGTMELAGVGVGSSLFLLLVWMLAQSKSAISAIVSRHFGKGQLVRLGSFVVQSLYFNLLIGILTIVISLYFVDELLRMYNASGELLAIAKDYFTIRVFGLPLALATFGLYGVFRGFQNTSWAMWISLSGGVLNILLDYILVYGIKDIVPSMGIAGAAWASLVSQSIVCFSAIYVLMVKELVKVSFKLKLDQNMTKFVKMFSNLLIRTIALNTAYFLGTKYATAYGKEYIAAHTIAMNIWLFSSFFMDGYATAVMQ